MSLCHFAQVIHMADSSSLCLCPRACLLRTKKHTQACIRRWSSDSRAARHCSILSLFHANACSPGVPLTFTCLSLGFSKLPPLSHHSNKCIFFLTCRIFLTTVGYFSPPYWVSIQPSSAGCCGYWSLKVGRHFEPSLKDKVWSLIL